MKDGAVRRTVKGIARGLFAFDLRMQRRVRSWRGRDSWTLGGECERCAKCCDAPAIQVGRWIWFWPSARAAFLWWQRAVNGFEVVREERGPRVFVFRCTHFDVKTRVCDSYESRPGICRDYPRALLDQTWPDFFPECGYRAVARNAGSLGKALEGQNLAPEKLAELKRRLHLE